MGLKVRVIPCLLLKNGLIVRSESFKYHQIIGDPTTQLSRYNQWGIDELLYLDISREPSYDVGRNDAKITTAGSTDILSIIREISRVCFMPLTFGGGIRSLADMQQRFANGADKITVNTLALERPELITEAAEAFGNQAIVVSIDVRKREGGGYEVFKGGHTPTGLDPAAWAAEAEKRGAGEILLNSIDRDGVASGYDHELVRSVVASTRIPVIALGGCGRWQHMVDVLQKAVPDAVAAANIFHFTEMSYRNAKSHLHKAGIDVRIPTTKTEP